MTEFQENTTNFKVIIFDNTCGLCNKTISLIIKKDKQKIFRFCSSNSQYAHRIKNKFKLKFNFSSSVIYINTKGIYYKSEAAIRIFSEFNKIYLLFLIIPKFIRDGIYSIISKNRTKLFKQCLNINSEYEDRFLN